MSDAAEIISRLVDAKVASALEPLLQRVARLERYIALKESDNPMHVPAEAEERRALLNDIKRAALPSPPSQEGTR